MFRTDAFALGSLNMMAPIVATTGHYLRRYLETRRGLLIVGIAGFALIALAGGSWSATSPFRRSVRSPSFISRR